jgi:hypothetical protein
MARCSVPQVTAAIVLPKHVARATRHFREKTAAKRSRTFQALRTVARKVAESAGENCRAGTNHQSTCSSLSLAYVSPPRQ